MRQKKLLIRIHWLVAWSPIKTLIGHNYRAQTNTPLQLLSSWGHKKLSCTGNQLSNPPVYMNEQLFLPYMSLSRVNYIICTLNESYNRPPYILAASSENKIHSSKIFSFIHKKNPCPVSSIYFISKRRLLLP